jgi:hypothetical protein
MVWMIIVFSLELLACLHVNQTQPFPPKRGCAYRAITILYEPIIFNRFSVYSRPPSVGVDQFSGPAGGCLVEETGQFLGGRPHLAYFGLYMLQMADQFEMVQKVRERQVSPRWTA